MVITCEVYFMVTHMVLIITVLYHHNSSYITWTSLVHDWLSVPQHNYTMYKTTTMDDNNDKINSTQIAVSKLWREIFSRWTSWQYAYPGFMTIILVKCSNTLMLINTERLATPRIRQHGLKLYIVVTFTTDLHHFLHTIWPEVNDIFCVYYIIVCGSTYLTEHVYT